MPCRSHEAISGHSSIDFKPSSERLCLNFAEIASCSMENELGGLRENKLRWLCS